MRAVARTCVPHPQPACRDSSRKGQASRSVQVVITGTREQVTRLMRRRAEDGGEQIEEGFQHPLGHVRSQTLSRGARFPAVEEFQVVAPSGVIEKQKKNFEKAWRETCRRLQLPA